MGVAAVWRTDGDLVRANSRLTPPFGDGPDLDLTWTQVPIDSQAQVV